MANIHLKTNIPSFHHSIIPFPEQIRKPEKPLYSQQVVEIPRRCSYCLCLGAFVAILSSLSGLSVRYEIKI
jgi:hypothetical protein